MERTAQFGNMLRQKVAPWGDFFCYFLAIRTSSFLTGFLSSDFFLLSSKLLALILPSSIQSAPYSSRRTLMQPAIGIEIIAPARPKV